MNSALDETFAALAEANRAERAPAPLSALTVGLQCGGSDGFSGISANPSRRLCLRSCSSAPGGNDDALRIS